MSDGGALVADPLRFHKLASGRENLRARAAAALERVGLGDWISSLPDGVDTFVFKDGMIWAQTVRYTPQAKG